MEGWKWGVSGGSGGRERAGWKWLSFSEPGQGRGGPRAFGYALHMMHIRAFRLECIVYNAISMDLETIGTLFKEARRQSRRTQDEIARPLGMSRATLSALEGGRCMELGVRKLTALLQSVGLDLYAAPSRARPTLEGLREERRRKDGGA